MKKQKNTSTPCIVRESAIRYAQRAGLISAPDAELDESKIVDSVRGLMALGLTPDEIEELDFRQPVLQAVSEYTVANGPAAPSHDAPAMVNTTLRVIADQLQALDMETEMLNLRKKALRRRTRVLQKLAASLEGGDSRDLAA